MLNTFLWFLIIYLKKFQLLKRCYNDSQQNSLLYLPRELHVTLSLQGERIKRILFIGDVHGCYDELCELLKKVNYYESKDIIAVFVGDICNKGPKSIETLQHIRQLGSKAFSVRGNHEQAVLCRLKELENGVQPTKKYMWISELTEEDCLYLKQLPLTITIPLVNVIVVHGGLVPGTPLLLQKPKLMISMRNFVPETLSGTSNIDEGVPWAGQWTGPEFVIFGHDARRRLQKYRYAIGLDTGCLYGSRLTGFLINTDDGVSSFKNGKFVHVNAHHAYAWDKYCKLALPEYLNW